jgi:hypothetical protein
MAIIGELEYFKISIQWAPQMLTDAHKETRKANVIDLL